MKIKKISLAVLIFLCTFRSEAQQKTLVYVQSSGGLEYPEMDGGRTELEFADINLDGHVDILSIGDHGSPFIGTQQHGIMVWFGDGLGNWSVVMNDDGDFGYGGIAVGDVNNDGWPDVGYGMHHNYASGDFGDQLIEVALGDGTGINWIPWDDGLATNGESWGMFGTDFGDVDNDGDLDLGSTSFGSGSGVHVYRNNSDGTWSQSYGFLEGNSDMIFNFGDINNDGFLDFAVSHEYGTAYFGDGTGQFTMMDANLPPSEIMGRMGTSLGDVNNDGGADLAYVNDEGGLEVWAWYPDIWEWVDFSGNLPSSSDFEATQLLDMNCDGFVDLSAFGKGTFMLWLGDGQGNWTEETSFTTPPYGYFQAFRAGGDVDHNGYPDIAIVAEEGSGWVYQNHLYCYKEASIPQELKIFPVFPRGNEYILPGSVRMIEWLSTVPGNEESYVRLEFSAEGPDGPWMLIAQNLPDNGRFQWTIPYLGFEGWECYIRYTITDPNDSAVVLTPLAFRISHPEGIIRSGSQNEMVQFSIHPNPFTDDVRLDLKVNNKGIVTVDILNSLGQTIRNVYQANLPEGRQVISWDSRDEAGRELPPGIYFCRVFLNGEMVAARKIVH